MKVPVALLYVVVGVLESSTFSSSDCLIVCGGVRNKGGLVIFGVSNSDMSSRGQGCEFSDKMSDK